jgi:TM2 domain-containing membrane protein YozV
MNRKNIVKSSSSLFSTEWRNATKFVDNQVLMAITLALISGIGSTHIVSAFNGYGLVKALLKLVRLYEA